MNQLDKQLTELFQNPVFTEEAKGVQSVEELQNLFAAHGVEMSKKDVTELCIEIGKRASTEENDGELEENDLEKVAGGWGIITWTCIGLGVTCIGAFAMGVYNKYKELSR